MRPLDSSLLVDDELSRRRDEIFVLGSPSSSPARKLNESVDSASRGGDDEQNLSALSSVPFVDNAYDVSENVSTVGDVWDVDFDGSFDALESPLVIPDHIASNQEVFRSQAEALRLFHILTSELRPLVKNLRAMLSGNGRGPLSSDDLLPTPVVLPPEFDVAVHEPLTLESLSRSLDEADALLRLESTMASVPPGKAQMEFLNTFLALYTRKTGDDDEDDEDASKVGDEDANEDFVGEPDEDGFGDDEAADDALEAAADDEDAPLGGREAMDVTVVRRTQTGQEESEEGEKEIQFGQVEKARETAHGQNARESAQRPVLFSEEEMGGLNSLSWDDVEGLNDEDGLIEEGIKGDDLSESKMIAMDEGNLRSLVDHLLVLKHRLLYYSSLSADD